jgi:TPR repeat protein
MTRATIALLLLFALMDPAWAGFEEGLTAYKHGDYATALREWRPLAKSGDARAQHALGLMYRKGYGVPRDYATARSWFEKAANQGFDISQLNMALLYREGLGVAQNYAEAAKWYRKAALRGNVEAQYNLGLFYGKGSGVPKDDIQAYVWSDLAALLYPPGNFRDDAIQNRDFATLTMTTTQKTEAEAQAAFRQGWMYYAGLGVPADRASAIRRYCRAQELGSLPANGMLHLLAAGEKADSILMPVAKAGADPMEFATAVLKRLKAVFVEMGISTVPENVVKQLCH